MVSRTVADIDADDYGNEGAIYAHSNTLYTNTSTNNVYESTPVVYAPLTVKKYEYDFVDLTNYISVQLPIVINVSAGQQEAAPYYTFAAEDDNTVTQLNKTHDTSSVRIKCHDSPLHD